MKASVVSQRFAALEEERKAVLATEHVGDMLGIQRTYVDNQLLEKWLTKVRAFLRQLADAGAPQYAESFDRESKSVTVGVTNHGILKNVSAVFLATKEDSEAGWLVPLNALVRAEVFADELEQAAELLENGYAAPAAVIGRVVLETALKNLCVRHSVPAASLARMNDELKKANVYDAIVHKRVITLSAVGNAAAHGDPQFKPVDVEGMLTDVRRFIEDNRP